MTNKFLVEPNFAIELKGNQELAKYHIWDARVMAGYLMNQLKIDSPDQLYTSKSAWKELSDGTLIWCQVWRDMNGERAHTRILAGKPEVVIDPVPYVYLESGYQIGAYEALAPSQSTPGWLYYTDTLEIDYLNNDVTPSWLDFYTKEDKFALVQYGPPKRLSLASQIDSTGHYTYWTYFREIYVHAWRNHMAQTGKTVKLWQSQLGRKDMFIPELALELLGPAGSPNHNTTRVDKTIVLRTLPDMTYQLLKMTRDKVYSCALAFSDPGYVIYDRMLNELAGSRISRTSAGHDRARKLESYLFSCLISFSEWVEVCTFPDPIIGDPLFYGWKADWNGETVSLITHEIVTDGNPELECTLHLIAREYTYIPATNTLTLDGSHQWFPGTNIDHIWVPDQFVGVKLWYFWPNRCGCDTQPQGTDVPIYTWYNSEGEKNTIYYTTESYSVTEPTQSADDYFAAMSGGCGFGSVSGTYNIPERRYGAHGFYLNNKSAPGDVICQYGKTEYNEFREIKYTKTSDSKGFGCQLFMMYAPTNKCAGSEDIDTWSPPEFLNWAAYSIYADSENGTVEKHIKQDGGVDYFGNPILIIPYGSCEAAYLGKVEQTSLHGQEFYIGTKPGVEYDIVIQTYKMGYPDSPRTAGTISRRLDLNDQSYGALDLWYVNQTSLPNPYNDKATMYLVDNYKTDLVESIVDEEIGHYDQLIETPICGATAYPYYDNPLRVLQSDGGNMIYTKGIQNGAVVTDTGIPDDVLRFGYWVGRA